MTKDMTKGSPLRLILGFAFPMLLGMLFQQFYNLVDTMIVGKTLGVSALAGVGATSSINFMIIGFCMGICSGFAIPVAQQFGAGKYSVTWEEKFDMDVYYVDHISFLMDWKIIFQTVMTVLKRDGISSETAATMEMFTGTAENVDSSKKKSNR